MGAGNMKKIRAFIKAEKEIIILLGIILFLTFNLARATMQISELKAENYDLWQQVDRYIPTMEEND